MRYDSEMRARSFVVGLSVALGGCGVLIGSHDDPSSAGDTPTRADASVATPDGAPLAADADPGDAGVDDAADASDGRSFTVCPLGTAAKLNSPGICVVLAGSTCAAPIDVPTTGATFEGEVCPSLSQGFLCPENASTKFTVVGFRTAVKAKYQLTSDNGTLVMDTTDSSCSGTPTTSCSSAGVGAAVSLNTNATNIVVGIGAANPPMSCLGFTLVVTPL